MVKIETWDELITVNGNTPVIDNVTYYNAPNSIKFSIPGTLNGDSGVVSSFDFASSPGQSHILTGRVKAQGVGTSPPVLRLIEADINDNWLRANEIRFDIGTYDWTQKSLNIVTGPNTAFVYITSYLRNGYGTYWLDDVNLTTPSEICPALSASLSITPTTIVSGESITYTSEAIGGVSSDDGFGHEILIDGVPVFNTGLRNARIMSGTLQITGISSGTHPVTSRITDGCSPHQVEISSPTTLTVICPPLSASLSITPTTIISGGSINYISEAIGGVPSGDGFGHEILIDGVPVFNTGLRNARIMSGTLQITGISSGTHPVTSRITDGCLKTHQVETSSSTTLTVTCSALSGALSM